MSAMVKRVALAIEDAIAARSIGMYDFTGYPGDGPPHVVCDEITGERVFASHDRDEAQVVYDRLSRARVAEAAIAAMREPTSEMLDAGFLNGWDEVSHSETYPHQRGIWRAMIDAALAPLPASPAPCQDSGKD